MKIEMKGKIRSSFQYSILFIFYVFLVFLENEFIKLRLETEIWLCKHTIMLIVAVAMTKVISIYNKESPKFFFPVLICLITLMGLGLGIRYIFIK